MAVRHSVAHRLVGVRGRAPQCRSSIGGCPWQSATVSLEHESTIVDSLCHTESTVVDSLQLAPGFARAGRGRVSPESCPGRHR
eukprot:7831163-Pyramimonas_sp.AAC.1